MEIVKTNNKKLNDSTDDNERNFFDTINTIHIEFSNKLTTLREHNTRTLVKKERAINYYTISFIGKTKVGKSTLHSIMTGSGKEFIGKGKQRTTRFNRVFEWEQVRIIDTPGIGAPGGEVDEKIAESVIDESDIICYVLKNDSQQESEFKFLKTIKDSNKPIILLLNVKENLSNEKRLKMYLKNPEKWYTRKDSKNLEGHLNRIKQYANKYYRNDYFDIYPVQLLSAELSMMDEHQSNKNILYKSSHIQEFLDAIRLQVIDEGVIKKTQTIIDGTRNVLNKSLKHISEYNNMMTNLNDKLKSNKDKMLKNIIKAKDTYSEELEKELESLFEELKWKHAAVFAQNNYSENKDKLEGLWKEYMKKTARFEKRMDMKVKEYRGKYLDEVGEILKEFQDIMELFSKSKIDDIGIDTSGIFNWKKLIQITGGLMGLGGVIAFIVMETTLIGWALTIGSILVAGISSLLKNKEKRVSDAIDKITKSIQQGINKNQDKVIKKVISDFDKMHNDIISKIDKMLTILVDESDKVIKIIKPPIDDLEKSIDYLDRVYAYRIINYVNNNYKSSIGSDELENINVERKYGEEMKIFSNKKYSNEYNEKMTRIIQEDVIFLKKGEI